ncbi:DUF4102 domain-containing protein [Pseudoalteromonas sp. MMG010]|uniref:Arm DNA-binding domain-containing protein n=1 Tax=Pseudoalteromonas sp. MMG010 TaxID=2822685 RepID=UPI001B3A005E|nr:Arm DNA-binding domain-containing protein [Pseudoalteromonas sp. MMG010]MBQ4834384.1 DUF4102 domain-containing protein [Pseudoalteromonas sp. MMG010]
MNDKQVKALIKQGEYARHAIGRGLYLRITNQNIGYWVVRYTINKKRLFIVMLYKVLFYRTISLHFI